jgi:hypothetical protein
MDSLGKLLGKKDFDEPPEIAVIKKYIKDEFGVPVGVQLRDRDIIISTRSAALANTLRLRSPDIKRHCNLNKRLTFRIG